MNRRQFLQSAVAATATLAGKGIPWQGHAARQAGVTGALEPEKVNPSRTVVRFAAIADLHQDIMHDGEARLGAFLASVRGATEPLAAIVQMGDFAQVKPSNQRLVDQFNDAHPVPVHVLGNHDIDGGGTFENVVRAWKMPGRYATYDLGAIRLIVLDGNERPANHTRGYPAHVGEEQAAWLRRELGLRLDAVGNDVAAPWPPGESRAPAVVLIHQPIAGVWGLDNAALIQRLLSAAGRRVLFVMNGHTHLDQVLRVGGVTYFHLNSASYHWVGEARRHPSYEPALHARHPWIDCTCPYRDPLFAHLAVHLQRAPGEVEARLSGIEITGRESVWVGPSPSQLGADVDPTLVDGEQVVPQVRSRVLRPHVAT